MNRPIHLHFRQGGMASTLVAMTLLFAATLLVLLGARTSVMEAKIGGNEYRAREAREAAEAGLEFAVAWLASNEASWPALTAGVSTPYVQAGTLPVGVVVPDVIAIGGTYQNTISLSRTIYPSEKLRNYLADYVLVESTARLTGDTNVAAKVTQYVDQKHPVGNAGLPPLSVNGCIDKLTGTTNIYTSGGKSISMAASCSFTPDNSLKCNGVKCDAANVEPVSFADAFQSATGLSLTEFFGIATSTTAGNAAAAANQSPYNPYLRVTDDKNVNDDIGSPGRDVGKNPPQIGPVIIYMENCGGFSGNVTVYGWIFFPPQCKTPGLGNVTVYGSVITGGNITQWSGNPKIYEWPGGGNPPPFQPLRAPKMMGTWKDF